MISVNENKKETVRKRILNQGLYLFSEKGFNNVKMQDIADAAGVSKTTIYYSYIRSKEELIKIIVENELRKIITQIESLTSIEKEPKTALKEFLQSLLNPSGETQIFWNLIFRSVGDSTIQEIIKEDFIKLYEKYIDVITRFFRGIGNKNANDIAELCLALITGILFQQFLIPETINKKNWINQFINSFVQID
ncbi:MAG: TetR/AcrR family transcriptional regulator [Candidatus Hodarchaeales archaeon]